MPHIQQKTARVFAGLLSLVLLLSGCNANPPENANPIAEESTTALTFTDALDNLVTVNRPQRVVAVLGSFAEAWTQAGGQLVGVTDDAVNERHMELGEDIVLLGGTKNPSLEEIFSLSPDFVILSKDIGGHIELYEALRQADIPAAVFHVDRLEEYLHLMDIFTQITGQRALYENIALPAKLQAEETIAACKGKQPPTVLFIRAFSSGFKAKNSDSMTGAMLKDLGAVNIADSDDSLLEELSMEAIIENDPDFIFVTTMGSDEEKSMALLTEQLILNPAWNGLTAVKNGQYYQLPRELFHYKPNSRWGESYEYLAQLLYGEE